MEELITRLSRYTEQCIAERLDPDFADAVEQAKDKLQKPKWIPVSEKLPEIGKSVLVISYGRVCFAKLLLAINNGGFPTFVLQDGLNNPPVLETTAHNEFTENRITHWQYLPEPPKEETDG